MPARIEIWGRASDGKVGWLIRETIPDHMGRAINDTASGDFTFIEPMHSRTSVKGTPKKNLRILPGKIKTLDRDKVWTRRHLENDGETFEFETQLFERREPDRFKITNIHD